ncbi:MAG TPA: hypothetical protein VNX87_08505 [Candidatus Sulfotelmatobacter sp.]|jgi:hypothetical protein|nr:hypothetical protein [Candidatus Sulfotelmatobacter sp.]
MGPYFTRERFGRPQFLAALILLAFLAQALWLVHVELSSAQSMDGEEALRIGEGLKQWHGQGIASAPVSDPVDDPFVHLSQSSENGFDTEHSPLLSLVSAAPLLVWPSHLNAESATYWRWLPKLPFLACGLFLGASLWYVARRLCGNTGGFIALTLYAFSPSLIQAAAVWHTEPEIVAAWGAFGTIFTAIAVAHTLYAPREVVLWNWRRIVLLGVSLAIAIGSQFSMMIVVPMALIFLLYVAPVRRRAGLVIWIAACVVGLIVLLGIYFFHLRTFLESLRHAVFLGLTWRGFTVLAVYTQVAKQIGGAFSVFVVALPVTLITYCLWPRSRYFGNTAPLLVGVIFLILAMATPHTGGAGFLLAAIPFLLIFVSGVLADLLETRHRPAILAAVLTLLVTYIAGTLLALARVTRG